LSSTVLAWRRLDSSAPQFDRELAALTAFEAAQDPSVDAAVAAIVADVRVRGDAALLEYTARFDRVAAPDAAALEIPAADLQRALDALPAAQAHALSLAAERIRSFHERQKLASWTCTEADGSRYGQQVTPLDRVGVYVPGGRAAYPSSVLMNAIPARVAGVGEIVMVVPTPDGVRNPLVLAAARLAGVTRVFAIGGAQAIAALAYGTATVPAVDKICGPGNAYVAAAKRRVFGAVGIDLVAGASEVLVIADARAHPDWVAMDLFAQAEHDELAQAILVSPDAGLIEAVARSAEREVEALPRRAIVAASIARRGALIKARDLDDACAIANRVAPEHLELAVADPDALLPKIRHAGAIFAGYHASESLGDYCAGPNHVLPTGRTARFSSPLGVYDFQKRSSVLCVTPAAARALGPVAAALADGEGLAAHARAARLRVAGASARAVADRVAATVRPEIRALTAYAVAKAPGMIKLDAMENPYPLPDAVRARMAAALSAVPVNRYPDGDATAVKEALQSAFDIPEALGLLVGNGSDELIQIITTALARPGAVMLAPEPSFVMYRQNALLAGMRFVGVPLGERFALDVDAVLSAIAAEAPALVFLAYPNNPTGNLYAVAGIERILAAAPGLVVVDEAYHAFAEASFLPRIGEFPNLLVLRTVSKIGMAGLRLGYAVAAAEWTAELNKVRQPYNLNALTQAAAPVLLGERDLLAAQAAALRAERTRLAGALARRRGVEVFPTRTNFVLARVPDAPRWFEALRRAGILVKNLHGWHPSLAHCLRITVGTPAENDALLAALDPLA
jgi:histidinol dehydrogenase